ncbi:unnamed protein product [Ectocarpus sp. 13 AM-2016]
MRRRIHRELLRAETPSRRHGNRSSRAAWAESAGSTTTPSRSSATRPSP